MFEFTETITVNASPSTIWQVMIDLEEWWPPSNPEHQSVELLDDRGIEVGAQIRIREKVAGIPCVAEGQITRVDPMSEVTWEARARYRWWGVSVPICEGVTWRLRPAGLDTTRVSAHVWATYPPGLFGRFVGFVFTRLLDGIEKDREHARTELRYLKNAIEAKGSERQSGYASALLGASAGGSLPLPPMTDRLPAPPMPTLRTGAICASHTLLIA